MRTLRFATFLLTGLLAKATDSNLEAQSLSSLSIALPHLRSSIISPQAAPGFLQLGYFSDSLCTIPTSTLAYELNVCVYSTARSWYTLFTTTTTGSSNSVQFSRDSYTDSACTMSTGNSNSFTVFFSCYLTELGYTVASYPSYPMISSNTGSGVIISNYVDARCASSAHVPAQYAYYLNNFCGSYKNGFAKLSCAGSNGPVVNTYSDSKCTMPSGQTSSLPLGCGTYGSVNSGQTGSYENVECYTGTSSTTQIPSPSPTDAIYTTATFIQIAYYTDNSCTTLSSAFAAQLNICVYSAASSVYSVLITSSSGSSIRFITQEYSDSGCTQTVGEPSTVYISTQCTKAGNPVASLISTVPTVPSTAGSGIVISDYATAGCSSNPVLYTYYLSNNCNSFQNGYAKVSCSGADVSVTIYSDSACTVVAGRNSFTTGHCGSVVAGQTGSYEAVQCYTAAASAPSSPTTGSSAAASTKSCFSGSETVTLESGEVKAISEIRIGDRVLASNSIRETLFSEVVFIPHKTNTESALFIHITTEGGKDIKMTKNHILPAGVCGMDLPLVYASRVSMGDCVMTVSGQEKVSSVVTVRGEGVYTIVTNEEYIVVNGIIASPFGVNHMVPNLFYNIHRFVYALFPLFLTSSLLHTANEGLGFIVSYLDASVEAF